MIESFFYDIKNQIKDRINIQKVINENKILLKIKEEIENS